MAKKISEIEGIGPAYTEKLATAGITTIEQLLEKGASKPGRKEIAITTGIDESRILRWVNMADLFRIKGVGEEYSDLLEEAGVDTVVELSQRNPENLHTKILEVNEKNKFVKRPPSLTEIKSWINQAKTLPRKIKY